MKIFSAAQLRDWDHYTIKHQAITSVALMERAATGCFEWVRQKFVTKHCIVFCGKGNNGGDGLAIARLMTENKYNVSVFIVGAELQGSPDFQTNLAALRACSDHIHFIKNAHDLPTIHHDDLIIDAIFGTGLNKAPAGIEAALIDHLNNSGAVIVSVDIPSGLYADKSSNDNVVIKARYTLTFQQYKLAFLLAENGGFFGRIIVLSIDLPKDYYYQTEAGYELIDISLVKAMYKSKDPFSNKGTFGHACLLAGSYGMMGAAVLAAKACLRSGVGKLTMAVCKQGNNIMQTAVPGAMCNIYGNTFVKDFMGYQAFNVIGVGPGIGIHATHDKLLLDLFKQSEVPLVLDADALNTIAKNKKLLQAIPPHSIITPHPKEFDRLFGNPGNDFERMELAKQKSIEHQVFIILKGHHTLIATPDKKAYFNNTGNAGMAKGGSGDILTGILTGMVAQKYPLLSACLLGVYLHGLAGDIAAYRFSQEAMIAADIIDSLGEAFKTLAE